MSDYISRQAAIDIAYPFDDNERNLVDALEELTTADVRENVKANLVIAGYKRDGSTQWFECSVCGGAVDFTDNFCKHCGAQIRGES